MLYFHLNFKCTVPLIKIQQDLDSILEAYRKQFSVYADTKLTTLNELVTEFNELATTAPPPEELTKLKNKVVDEVYRLHSLLCPPIRIRKTPTW